MTTPTSQKGPHVTPPTRRSSPGPKAVKSKTDQQRETAKRRLLVRVTVGVAIVGALLFAVFQTGGGNDATNAAGPPFDVGTPGPGAQAPTFELPSTSGGTFDLADARGDTVLLYFQEGIMCQPCWDQIDDIEERFADFQALGVDRMVSITTDDLDLLRQKVTDEDLQTPVLSDPDLALAEDYNANQYGMMGTSMYGHSFILVGPDGEIQWRADYGGAPDYTMYLPPDQLLDDLRSGLEQV